MKRCPLVLVTGASGAVGPHVVEAFHAGGYAIRTLSIDPPPAGVWPEDVEALIGDVTDASAVSAAMQGVELVIHLAALLHIVNPPPAGQEQYEKINVGGTSTVVAAALQAGVRRVVFFSTIAVYGPSRGQILTEDTPPRPDTFYARTKLAAEKIVLDAKNAEGAPLGVVLRLGAIYGSGIKGNYQRLVQSLAKGRFIPVGDGSNRRSLVYDRDVALAASLAATHPAAAGRVYNITDGEWHTMKDIIATLCDALGRKPPAFMLPISPVRWAAGLLETSAKLVHFRSPVTRETVTKYMEDLAVDSRRVRQELGFSPLYNLASGWKETVREMRQAGLL